MSQPSVRRPFRVSWWGLIVMLAGIGLIVVYSRRPTLWSSALLPKIVYLGLGGLLILGGLRAVLSEVWPVVGRIRREGWSGYRVRMPREAAVFLGILFMLFLGALLGRSNMLVLVFGLLAGPFVLNGSITLNMLRKTRVSRSLPERVMAGQVFSVDLTLSNAKRWMSSWMMEVHDAMRSRYEHLAPAVLFTRVPPKSSRTGNYQARLAHRGLYELGPLQVSSRFPLGLMERVIELGEPERLVVFPQIGRLLPAWHRALAYNNQLVEQPRTRKGSFDDEFHQLREYRTGDNPRAIHWRTTARRSTLMVRDFHQNRDQDLYVALDAWLPEWPTPADLERVELAVSFAATICMEHCGQSGESRLWLGVAGSSLDEWDGQATLPALDEVLERLALAEASSAAPLDRLISRLESHLDGKARRVLISTRPEPAAGAPHTTPQLAAAHALTISADPAVLAEYFERDPV